jgi:GNAT superfamily N-acetyltransferase
VSPIRPLERADLPDVCGLFERVMRSGSPDPPPQLVGYFERTLLMHPWVDPDIPSLVYSDADGRIVGLIASHVRRLRIDGRKIQAAYTGPFVADPDPRWRGVGALLLRKFLDGPQEFTMTDAGNETARLLSEKLGMHTLSHCSIRWTRVLRPLGSGVALVAWRNPGSRLTRPLRALSAPVDAASRILGRHALAPPRTQEDEPLTIEAMVGLLSEVARAFSLHPDYDEAFLDWLFREVAVVDVFGTPVRNLVRAPDGQVAGWYVYYLVPGGFATVLQVVALGSDPGMVLDHLFWHAASGGAVAIGGRVESHLLAALFARRCIFHRSSFSSFVLVHSKRLEVLAALGCGRVLLTRLDGESWMGHQTLWRGDRSISKRQERHSESVSPRRHQRVSRESRR